MPVDGEAHPISLHARNSTSKKLVVVLGYCTASQIPIKFLFFYDRSKPARKICRRKLNKNTST
jgi:hypothetical protein